MEENSGNAQEQESSGAQGTPTLGQELEEALRPDAGWGVQARGLEKKRPEASSVHTSKESLSQIPRKWVHPSDELSGKTWEEPIIRS